jgi:hypothetical protein
MTKFNKLFLGLLFASLGFTTACASVADRSTASDEGTHVYKPQGADRRN